MSSYTFTDPATAREYQIQVPNGVSREQAKSLFDQQLNTGALAGFDVGKSLSAATQAAGGLSSALPMINQNLGSLTGALPGAANLNTVASTLGPGAAAAATQVTSSLKGVQAAAATNIQLPTLGQLPGDQTSGLSNIVGGVSGSVMAVGTALSGAASQVGSLASKAVSGLTSALSGPVTDGINTADLVKQGVTTGIPGLNGTETQAAMSQAAKLVGQPRGKISDDQGVGKFGFDLSQLELAGIVKKGLSVVAVGATLTSVLKSPTSFTGKAGILGISALLANESAQNDIQKGLMQNGLSSLKSAGIPVSDFNPGAVAGLANNAAKDVSGTLQNLAGTASATSKAAFDSVSRNSAFAVNLANNKVDPAALNEVTAEPATDTVDTETVNAASKRIVGNDKAPDVSNIAPSRTYTTLEYIQAVTDARVESTKFELDTFQTLIKMVTPPPGSGPNFAFSSSILEQAVTTAQDSIAKAENLITKITELINAGRTVKIPPFSISGSSTVRDQQQRLRAKIESLQDFKDITLPAFIAKVQQQLQKQQ
jgi:hypothetical protein